MRNTISVIALVLISSFIFSCESDDNSESPNDFQKSSNALSDFKKTANNSYQYTVTAQHG